MTKLQWPEFFFVRHGETAWNAEGRFQGQQDIPLNQIGQSQADAVGPLLRELMARDNIDPGGLDWFCSPMKRASETMQRVRGAFDQGLPDVIYDKRLVEVSFGILEGKLLSSLSVGMQIVPGKRTAEYWDYRPEKGENYQDLANRIRDFAPTMTKPSVIVAHGGVWRALRHLVTGTSKVEAINWPPPQGAVGHFASGSMSVYKI